MARESEKSLQNCDFAELGGGVVMVSIPTVLKFSILISTGESSEFAFFTINISGVLEETQAVARRRIFDGVRFQRNQANRSHGRKGMGSWTLWAGYIVF